MRKYIITIIICFITIFCSSCSCNGETDYNFEINEYTGVKITSVTYIRRDDSVDFKKIDLVKNQYLKKSCTVDEFENEGEKVGKYEFQTNYYESDEKTFVDGIYSAGLLNLEDEYKNNITVHTYYDWYLTIEFEDGTKKQSKGMGASPDDIFNKCSTFFYDICREEVIGQLPDGYLVPQPLRCSLEGYSDNMLGSSVISSFESRMLNYLWNYNNSINNNAYEINKKYIPGPTLLNDADYKITFYDSYYKKFSRFILKSYDYNKGLTNEKVVCDVGYFEEYTIDLERDKIYIYTVDYEKNNFYSVTFNTISDEILNGYMYDYTKDKNMSISFKNDKFYLYLSEVGKSYELITGTYELKDVELIDEHTGEMSKQRLLYCYVEGDYNTYFCMKMTIDSLAYMKEKSTYSLDMVNEDYFELYPFYCSVYDVIKK